MHFIFCTAFVLIFICIKVLHNYKLCDIYLKTDIENILKHLNIKYFLIIWKKYNNV